MNPRTLSSLPWVAAAVALPVALVAGQKAMTPQLQISQLNAVVNLKQLALGMNVYADDFDDVYPNVKDLRTLKVVTYPYVGRKAYWQTENPGSEIRFNASVGGVVRKSIKNPAETVIFYEAKPWPDGRRGASFVNGGAKLLATHEWSKASLSLLLTLPKKAGFLPDALGKTWKD